MRIALTGIIVESLYEAKSRRGNGGLTLEELQRDVTKRRVREGLTPSTLRLIKRSPLTILRLFRKVPKKRIVRSLLVLHEYKRIEVNEWCESCIRDSNGNLHTVMNVLDVQGTIISLTDDVGEKSYQWWQETRQRLAQK